MTQTEKKAKSGLLFGLSLFLMLSMLTSITLSILWLLSITPQYLFYISMMLVLCASIIINISSISKRNRPEENIFATLPKKTALLFSTVSMLWILSVVLGFCKQLFY